MYTIRTKPTTEYTARTNSFLSSYDINPIVGTYFYFKPRIIRVGEYIFIASVSAQGYPSSGDYQNSLVLDKYNLDGEILESKRINLTTVVVATKIAMETDGTYLYIAHREGIMKIDIDYNIIAYKFISNMVYDNSGLTILGDYIYFVNGPRIVKLDKDLNVDKLRVGLGAWANSFKLINDGNYLYLLGDSAGYPSSSVIYKLSTTLTQQNRWIYPGIFYDMEFYGDNIVLAGENKIINTSLKTSGDEDGYDIIFTSVDSVLIDDKLYLGGNNGDYGTLLETDLKDIFEYSMDGGYSNTFINTVSGILRYKNRLYLSSDFIAPTNGKNTLISYFNNPKGGNSGDYDIIKSKKTITKSDITLTTYGTFGIGNTTYTTSTKTDTFLDNDITSYKLTF